MYPLLKSDKPVAKAFYHHSTLPNYIDQEQPPVKRKPFSTLRGIKWAQCVDLILPAAAVEQFQDQHTVLRRSHVQELNRKRKREGATANDGASSKDVERPPTSNHDSMEVDPITESNPPAEPTPAPLRYAKVILKPLDIISNPFFTDYIKLGNITLLSEGRPGVDNRFSLHEGVLHIELEKATYERAGLTGKAIPDGGRKHHKNRFAVDLDLRQPSMLHGKKGFERIVWAFREVLNESLTWLFYDARQEIPDYSKKPIENFYPNWFTIVPSQVEMQAVEVPSWLPLDIIKTPLRLDGVEAGEMLEFLSLVILGSARVQSSHTKVDPYICRYEVPSEAASTQDLVRLRWRGLIPSEILLTMLIAATKTKVAWCALQVSEFDGQSVTILVRQEGMMEWIA